MDSHVQEQEELIAFWNRLGFEFVDNKYYKHFSKNEGTCELTLDGAKEVKAEVDRLLDKLTCSEHVLMVDGCIGCDPKLALLKWRDAHIHRLVIEELKALVPQMNAEDYGFWVRTKIVDRITELSLKEEL